MNNTELHRCDGLRDGYKIEADASESFEAWLDNLPVSEPQPPSAAALLPSYAPIFSEIFGAHFRGVR